MRPLNSTKFEKVKMVKLQKKALTEKSSTDFSDEGTNEDKNVQNPKEEKGKT